MEALLGWLGADVGEAEIAVRTKARAKLGALLGPELDDVLPSLGRLLRLRVDTTEDAGSAERIREAYVRWLEAVARQQPVVVALEDVHWADTATRELAEAVLDLAERAPVALVLTEEIAPGSEGAALRLRALGDHGHRTTQIALGPLPDDAADEMLTGILGGEVDAVTPHGPRAGGGGKPPLPRGALAGASSKEAWSRAGGRGRSPCARTSSRPRSRISSSPGSTACRRRRASLLRSRRRSVARSRWQRSRRSSVATSARASPRSSAPRSCARLDSYPVFECSFTHGLLHDAALSTVTPTRKRELYARVASAFESLYAESLDDHLERLAHYHAQAGNLPKAFEYAERARGGSG